MVDRTEFGDHAGIKQDSEILGGLDKQRNGKFIHKWDSHLDVSILYVTREKLRPNSLAAVLERIVFSGKVIKYNRFGMKQERVILLTNLYLSNIKKKRK